MPPLADSSKLADSLRARSTDADLALERIGCSPTHTAFASRAEDCHLSQPPALRARPDLAGVGIRGEAVTGPSPGWWVFAGAARPFALFVAWRERRFAAHRCRELLKLYWTTAAAHPDLTGAKLYRRVLAARVGSDPVAAEAVLQHAEQSYAIWPVSRALNFRDVVHYIAVSEFIASHIGTHWIHADMKRIVESSIPHNI